MSSPATRLLALPVVLTSALLLAGCGAEADESGNGRRVVASFYPLAWVTERVAGDDYEVTNLTQPGGEPHDLELGIAQTAAIDEAELVVVEHGFQPAVDEAVENVGDAEVLDVAEVLDLREAEDHDGAEHVHEEEAHEEDGHDHGDLDPHFWHDPLLMADLADAVVDSLTGIDPDGADAFEANAAALRAELEQLDASYADGLTGCERDVVVVSHDAFGYLSRYGLHFEPIAGLSPDAEPTPAVLGQLQELIRTEGVTTVFSERLASPAMAEALAHDTGAATAVLDPIEGLSEGPSDETADADYLSLMRENLEALRKANGC